MKLCIDEIDEIESITAHKDEEGINRGKTTNRLNEVEPVENVNNNLQSYLEVSPRLKEVLPSHKLQDHAYE